MPFLRGLPPGVGWLFASAIVLVADATYLEVAGQRGWANWGFFGGAVAIAIAVWFGDWSRPRAPPRR